MSPRVRVYAIVAGCAVGAAASVVAITAAMHEDPPQPLGLRKGKPPFAADATAPAALTREVRAAIRVWPAGTIPRLRGLADAHPRSAFVRVNLGLALLWARQNAEAIGRWREAVRVDPNSPAAVSADDLLHPDSPPGLPFFVPEDDQLSGDMIRGITFQRLRRPVSAEQAFAAAARKAPTDPEAQVAAATSRFRKSAPERAFARLGPLVRRFPRAQTVRFHLGLLSIWIRDFSEARRQLERARALAPESRLGREANTLLASLVKVGTD